MVSAVQNVVADTVTVEVVAADGQPLVNAALLIERKSRLSKCTGSRR